MSSSRGDRRLREELRKTRVLCESQLNGGVGGGIGVGTNVGTWIDGISVIKLIRTRLFEYPVWRRQIENR